MENELDEFKSEILENLQKAEDALLYFDGLEDGHSSAPHYDEVFRTYHNIKGAAGMFEWNELQSHVHQLESVLMQTKATSSVPKHLVSWFLKGNDAIRAIIANEPYEFDYNHEVSEVQETEAPVTNAVQEELPSEFHTEVSEALERVSMHLLDFEKGEFTKNSLDELYRDIHSVKGACQLFGLVEASALSHSMESALEPLRVIEVSSIDPALVNTLLLCVDLLPQCLSIPTPETVSKEVKFMSTLLAPFQNVEEVVSVVEEAPVELPKLEKVASSPQASQSSQTESEKNTDSTIRVQVSLLDRLMTLMGEMVLVRNQVLQYSNKTEDIEFLNLSQKLDVVTSELQEETMKTRMQPIGNVLTKFQRVVRDIAANVGKKINLNLHGVETELDKTLIEAVKDPLTHIVRNACDHGIESPEARKAQGKPEAGTVTIKAYHEGGHVVVDISDDGKGLSREKLLKKALDKGIIDSAKAEKLSDKDIQRLIFAPGFSTAEAVTNLSGRGVGMDVVKSNVERIGGYVDISSVEGEGTKISLKIPLTLAIVPAMIIRSKEDRFAIPQVKLVELVRLDRTAIEFIQGKPIFRLRGKLLPLIYMDDVLGFEGDKIEEAVNIVILNSEGQLFGIIVDEILDTADIVVKPLAKFLKPISIYSGATVLGDGRVALIMDVQGIAQKFIGPRENEETEESFDSDDIRIEEELREFVLIGLGAKAKHALPLTFVNRMEEIPTHTIELSGHQRVIRYRGEVLRIVSLNTILGYPQKSESRDTTQVIVMKAGSELVGFEVDEILDVYSSREYLDGSVTSHEAITGNLVTDEGIVVVLDVDKIIEISQRTDAPKKYMEGAPRLLIVEDTESIRNKISKDLEEKGFSVTVACDGVDGLKKIVENSGKFDVIISDIEMPRLNGFEFAKKVRTIQKMKNVPMIAFTTKNGEEDLREAKASGFSTYLEKGKSKLLPLLVQECISIQKRRVA